MGDSSTYRRYKINTGIVVRWILGDAPTRDLKTIDARLDSVTEPPVYVWVALSNAIASRSEAVRHYATRHPDRVEKNLSHSHFLEKLRSWRDRLLRMFPRVSKKDVVIEQPKRSDPIYRFTYNALEVHEAMDDEPDDLDEPDETPVVEPDTSCDDAHARVRLIRSTTHHINAYLSQIREATTAFFDGNMCAMTLWETTKTNMEHCVRDMAVYELVSEGIPFVSAMSNICAHMLKSKSIKSVPAGENLPYCKCESCRSGERDILFNMSTSAFVVWNGEYVLQSDIVLDADNVLKGYPVFAEDVRCAHVNVGCIDRLRLMVQALASATVIASHGEENPSLLGEMLVDFEAWAKHMLSKTPCDPLVMKRMMLWLIILDHMWSQHGEKMLRHAKRTQVMFQMTNRLMLWSDARHERDDKGYDDDFHVRNILTATRCTALSRDPFVAGNALSSILHHKQHCTRRSMGLVYLYNHLVNTGRMSPHAITETIIARHLDYLFPKGRGQTAKHAHASFRVVSHHRVLRSKTEFDVGLAQLLDITKGIRAEAMLHQLCRIEIENKSTPLGDTIVNEVEAMLPTLSHVVSFQFYFH